MARLRVLIAGGISALALAGCGAQLDRAEGLDPEGSSFDKSLYAGYVNLAKSETGEGDYRDSDTFAGRAIASATGGSVAPEAIAARNLPNDHVGELTTARARLMDALAKGAGEKAPNETAKAQVMFDCWMQEQEENFQPDDIAACRGGYYDAMADVEGAIRPKTVAKAEAVAQPASQRFVVYFETDSSKLDAAAMEVLEEAKAAAAKLEGGKVSLLAGTDTVGNSTYNLSLSDRRAEAVVEAMISSGVPAGTISAVSFGEHNLAVPTGDNVDTLTNRRVEILVGQ